MGATDPAGPVLDRDEVDRALARLGAEHEAIESSLLALQDHAGRRLLEGAELTGTTKERWTAAEASITLLWAYFDAYTDALRHAREIRSRRRWSSREDLLELTELGPLLSLYVGRKLLVKGLPTQLREVPEGLQVLRGHLIGERDAGARGDRLEVGQVAPGILHHFDAELVGLRGRAVLFGELAVGRLGVRRTGLVS